MAYGEVGLLTRSREDRGGPVGLLINFGAPTLREGLRRIVNGVQPSASSRLRVNQSAAAAARGDRH